MKLWKKGFNAFLFGILGLAILQSFAPPSFRILGKEKTERTRVIKKDFDAKEELKVSHEHGPMFVKKSTDGRTHVEAEILVTGTDEASIEEMLGRLDLETKEAADLLELRTNMGIENWNKVNDKATIKFCDGDKLKGISDFKVTLTLFVADPKRLKLSNKYDKIELTDAYNGDLAVILYSGDLITGDLGGQFKLDLKYGKAKLGAVGNANWVIYDAEINAGPIQSAKVSSKYSEYRIGSVSGDLMLETYDEEWRTGNIGGKLRLDDKYSEFEFGNLGNADIKVFDGRIEAQAAGDVVVNDSKYTEYKFNSVASLKLGNVFDDDFEIGEASQIEALDSKYTEYRVDKLGKAFVLGQSFDDAIKINQVLASFNQISVDAKYTELEMSIAEGTKFEFSVNMKYGKVNYPENRVDIRKHVEKNSDLELVANVGGEQTGTPFNTVKVSGFDNTVTWR
ncbi:MAG: hypothetical protein IT258_14340 [Saprospiraceae bacterium]|nr:hypothetical protein [Saprospiraceae bacterium]